MAAAAEGKEGIQEPGTEASRFQGAGTEARLRNEAAIVAA